MYPAEVYLPTKYGYLNKCNKILQKYCLEPTAFNAEISFPIYGIHGTARIWLPALQTCIKIFYSMVCYFNVSSLNFHVKCFSSVRHDSPLVVSTVLLVNSMGLDVMSLLRALTCFRIHCISHCIILFSTRNGWLIVFVLVLVFFYHCTDSQVSSQKRSPVGQVRQLAVELGIWHSAVVLSMLSTMLSLFHKQIKSDV